MNADPINMLLTSHKATQKKYLTKSLKDILFQDNQSIEANKSEHQTRTLTTTFHKPVGEANIYVRFGYIPHKIF